MNLVSYRLLLALAAHLNWEISQWDVKSAYPNASISEIIYVQQPTGFEDGTNRVCRLNKALYGLKQSAREWENHLRALNKNLGLIPLKIDQSVYISQDKIPLILIVYVDDILAMSSSKARIKQIY